MKPSLDLSTAAATLNAAATVVVSPKEPGYDLCTQLTIVAELQGITGGTLDVVIQDSADGVKWFDYVHFAQLAAAAAAVVYSYDPTLNDTISTIGKAVDPATPVPVLAAGLARGGHPLQFLRAVYIAGAGASAGVAQTLTVFAR